APPPPPPAPDRISATGGASGASDVMPGIGTNYGGGSDVGVGSGSGSAGGSSDSVGMGIGSGASSGGGGKATGGGAGKGASKGVSRGAGLRDQALSLPNPEYPAIARAARAQGSVGVKVLVDEEGNVVGAEAVSGHPLLRSAAVAAARAAKFRPTVVEGKPAKVAGLITYDFVLSSDNDPQR
ncbi:MAG: TonB family protein, partial [Rubrivivax sp.]|nr:TonB family protein [Pyrinomonadaceae bacterium]